MKERARAARSRASRKRHFRDAERAALRKPGLVGRRRFDGSSLM